MTTLLLIAFGGNLIDTAATLYLSSMGYTELNPIMAPLLQWPVLFALVKCCAMGYALRILWRNKAHQMAKVLARVAAAVYGAISIYYAVFLTVWV